MLRKAWLAWMVLMAVLAPLSAGYAQTPELKYLDKDALKGMLGNPQVLILDVRTPRDWSTADKKIKGAVRQDPNKAAHWGKTLPRDQKIVLYCS